jgi:hypothetical protein
MKKYEIEYKDCTSMRCGVEIAAISEKEAIINLQQGLIDDGDYMTELIDVIEKCYIDNKYCKCDDCDPKWTLENGTPLDENDQELLNYAFDTYVNEDGLTMREVMDKQIKNN